MGRARWWARRGRGAGGGASARCRRRGGASGRRSTSWSCGRRSRRAPGSRAARRPACRLHRAHPVEASLDDQLAASGDLRVAAPLLADVADPLPHLAGLPPQVEAGHGGLAAGGGQQRGEHPQGGRLAGPVGAEEAEGLTSRDIEVDAGNRLDG